MRPRARFRPAPQSSGIGAGISWAIAPDFGEKMVPLFKENNFKLGFDYVTAEALNSAIQRAMFQWANNHKYLTFFNVSDKCAAAEGADCAAAEVYIHAGTGGEAFNWAPLRVSHTYNASGTTVRTTAGELIDAQQIVKSEVRFFTDHPVELPDFRTGQQCFYLDETFCEPFQRAQLTYDAKLITEVVCFAVWAAAFLMTLKRVSEYFRSYRRKGAAALPADPASRALGAPRGRPLTATFLCALAPGPPLPPRRGGGRQGDAARAHVAHPLLLLHDAHAHPPARLLLGGRAPVLPLLFV